MSVRPRSSGKPLLATTAGRNLVPANDVLPAVKARRQPVSLRQALARVGRGAEPLTETAPVNASGAALPRWIDAARRERTRRRTSAAQGWLATVAVTGLIIAIAAHFLSAHRPAAAPAAARVIAPSATPSD